MQQFRCRTGKESPFVRGIVSHSILRSAATEQPARCCSCILDIERTYKRVPLCRNTRPAPAVLVAVAVHCRETTVTAGSLTNGTCKFQAVVAFVAATRRYKSHMTRESISSSRNSARCTARYAVRARNVIPLSKPKRNFFTASFPTGKGDRKVTMSGSRKNSSG